MTQNKTQPHNGSVTDFIDTITPQSKRDGGYKLLEIFERVSGFSPVMWGPSIIGFGRYNYRYKTGREGTFLATGFSPQKSAFSIYIMPGYQDYSDLLSQIGKHKTGASCLYINKLEDIDLDILETLIKRGLDDLNKLWTVEPLSF